MISPKLRAMRLRAVSNKRLAYLREARKEMRAEVRSIRAQLETAMQWGLPAEAVATICADKRVKYDG
jgi:hypothetical protein